MFLSLTSVLTPFVAAEASIFLLQTNYEFDQFIFIYFIENIVNNNNLLKVLDLKKKKFKIIMKF